jgi:hypothetical protein
MPSPNDFLVGGLCLLFFVGVLRLCGVRRIPGVAFVIVLFFAILAGSVGWAYWEWRRTQDMPAYRTEWRNGALEDLEGNPLDPASFKGPYAE